MLFHSLPFLLGFLPLAIVAYYWLPNWVGREADADLRRCILIFASVVFYGVWDVRFVPLLIGSVVTNWAFARAFARWSSAGIVRCGVAFNLCLLGLFKYFDFFTGEIAALLHIAPGPLGLILPLGISFFTFQQISYLVDLERGATVPYRLVEYAAYVMFFPHLIAGPIVRHNELVAQMALSPFRSGLDERVGRGLVLFTIGAVKKVFLADPLAQIADPLFAAAASGAVLSLIEAWTATIAFGLQIYFDFSGYSDMAIGLALVFGFTFPINFNAPYVATSIREFWRRWHMTLSRLLRDYLYIPLGGNRRGLRRQAIAVGSTMLLGGLWHGAGWTFIAWGGLHGLALAVNQAWSRSGRRLSPWIGWALTMLVVLAGWTLFRAPDFATAGSILKSMIGAEGLKMSEEIRRMWLVPMAAAIAMLGPTSQAFVHDRLRPHMLVAAAAGLSLVLVMLQAGGGANTEFIYFQF